MNQKHIGIILIILGILAASFVFITKSREDRTIALIAQQQDGSCFLDGTCLHQQSFYPYLAGWVVAASLIILGIYLTLFDKTQQQLAQRHLEISKALREAKQQEKQKDEFSAFLSGFTEEEQKALKAIHEQEGMKQATLRYKVGMSKASLSLLIKSLEERGIITKKPSGKTNELYLMKRF